MSIESTEYFVIKARSHEQIGKKLNELSEFGWQPVTYAIDPSAIHHVILQRSEKVGEYPSSGSWVKDQQKQARRR